MGKIFKGFKSTDLVVEKDLPSGDVVKTPIPSQFIHELISSPKPPSTSPLDKEVVDFIALTRKNASLQKVDGGKWKDFTSVSLSPEIDLPGELGLD